MVSLANTKVINTDVLIIGAGLAGLSTALALPKSLDITILSKADLQACSSHYAQGGIAASLAKDDSISDHVADTLIAGAGLCAPDNTTRILSQGQQAVQWLCAQGVPFTQIPLTDSTQPLNISANVSTDANISDLHLTKEGGHGCRRVAHADDATGRHIMQALIAKAQLANNITILPFHEALTLLTKSASANNNLFNNKSISNESTSQSHQQNCYGAIVFDHSAQQQLTIHSRAVVMASGGLGQLFARASAPNVCVGDGVMMAWQAGCRLANLEFVQFHPTGLALADSSFLVSEALRGEGGYLYCPKTGKRFMLGIDERAELAPRDIVARAIAAQIASNGLGFVHLDISHLPAQFIKQHFPQIYQTLLALGLDITTDPIPVAPTAHYSCGGIVTCSNGLTDVQGLYAAGEVAYTGLHGANRLASNSLLECVAVGRNIAAHLPDYLENHQWLSPRVEGHKLVTLPFNKLATLPFSTLSSTKSINTCMTDIATISAKLKTLMSSHLGITRHAKQLEQALLQIQQWQQDISAINYDKYEPWNLELLKETLTADPSSATLNALNRFQLARQLQLATLIVQSAYQRYESRGGHYRQDYPNLASQPKISMIMPRLANIVDNENWCYETKSANNDDLQAASVI
ncbi:MAG: L-aspartate oxidase [Psychrobacter sp.]|nr:L-aspartate oxidase [Psychrobacter sp.]